MENYSRVFPLGSSRNVTLENHGLACAEHFTCVTGPQGIRVGVFPAVPGLPARALTLPALFPSVPFLEGAIIAGQVLEDRKEKNHSEGTKVDGSTSVASVNQDHRADSSIRYTVSGAFWTWALAAMRTWQGSADMQG